MSAPITPSFFAVGFFPIKFLARAGSELVLKKTYEMIPTFLMPLCQLVIGEVGMDEGHERGFSLFLKCDGHR